MKRSKLRNQFNEKRNTENGSEYKLGATFVQIY